MRVEFVSPYNHSPQTGIGRYVHAITKQLKNKIDVAICSPRFLPLTNQFSSLRHLPIGLQGHALGSIVHFSQIMGCAMMLWHPYHPSVATVHDLGVLELPEEWQMLDPLARQLLRLSLAGLKRVDLIIADSEFTRQGIIKHLHIPPERVITIHLGIDHEVFRPIPNARQKLVQLTPQLQPFEESPWLLYVGSELPRKNVGTLLKALALLRQDIPDVRLIKIGAAGGEIYRNETLRMIENLGLDEHVIFFEGVPEEKLPLYYSAADLFVTASKLEGFGFPVLEAMACGTPVMHSAIPALLELTDGLMVNFPVDDIIAFKSLAKKMIQDHSFVNGKMNAGIKRAQSFHWGETVKQLYEVYEQIQ